MSDRDVTVAPDDYTAKLMAEVVRLQDENAKLLKELEAEHVLAETLGHYHEDAKAENAKLREQLDTAEHNRKRNAREYARMCHENDKLRELVRDMWLADYAGHFSTFPAHQEHQAAIWHRICELGIEVDV